MDLVLKKILGIGIPRQGALLNLPAWGKLPYFALPSIVPLIAGKSITIYGNTLINVPIVNDLTVTYACAIGTQTGNDLLLTTPVVGVYPCVITFKNKNVLIGTYNTTISVIPEASTVSALKILMVGDSVLNQGSINIASAIDSAIEPTITYLGILGTTVKHEGHGGWSWLSFIYDGSPFKKGGVINIPAYFTDNSIPTPDIVHFRIGVNDMFENSANDLTDTELSTIIGYSKQLIDAFLAFDANLKIIIGLPTLTGDSATAWNIDYDESVYNQNKYIEIMHKFWGGLITQYDAYNSRVFISTEALNLNRTTGYNLVSGSGLHPNPIGQTMLGDGLGCAFQPHLTVAIAPSGVTSSFIVDTISVVVNWTDTNNALAQYEVYSATNGGAETLLAMVGYGVNTYTDTTCKQNASVVYRVRAKKFDGFSAYVAATALVTPLCFKTNQTTLTPVVFGTLNLATSKSVTIQSEDGVWGTYINGNSNITHNFAATGQYNIWITGDTDSITSLWHRAQVKSYGNIGNWLLPSVIQQFVINTNSFTGDISNWIVPATCTYFYVYENLVSGKLPNMAAHASNGMNYQAITSAFSDSNVTVFRKAMNNFLIYDQTVAFPTANIDKLLKAAADWYQVNAPTNNCAYTLTGAKMGIPTNGNSNTDIVRLKGYYTAAGFTATVTIRTS